MSDVRAILVSDLHLHPRAPVARSAEPDWWHAMARPLAELQVLANRTGAPVLYAGDIFDRWNAGPETINFAAKHLPPGYAVPGQHDLPNHQYSAIQRTAYWTLCEIGVLTDLPPGQPTLVQHRGGHELLAYGYPWGHPVQPLPRPMATMQTVAVCHAFIWTKGTGYMGAPEEKKLAGYKRALANYTAAAFGDNHKGFIAHPRGGPAICNCGGFMARRLDERTYRPGCGLLLAGGTVVRHYWDTGLDKWLDPRGLEQAVDHGLDLGGLVQGLAALGAEDALSFVGSLREFCKANNIPQRVQQIIEEGYGG